MTACPTSPSPPHSGSGWSELASDCASATTSLNKTTKNVKQVGIDNNFHKGWGQSAKLGKHSAIWGKLGTALQAYALNPCTKFAANPTSRKVNT